MTVHPVPPSYGRRRKSDAVSSGRRRKRKKSTETKSGRRRRSDGTEPINLEGVTLRAQSSGRRRRSAGQTPISSGAAAPIDLKGVTLRSSKQSADDDETRDDDDGKQLVDPSADLRFAAVADQAYEDNRLKEYPSLKGSTFDPVVSDERNVVFHDKKDGSTFWGIRGTDFSSPKDLATDAAIVGEHVGEARFAKLKKLFSISPNMKMALPIGKKLILKSRDERFANTEAKYRQIRQKYKKGIINIGAHSLGAAVAQHLLKSLTPEQEKRVRVHAFNGLPLHGFDPEKHLGSYYETKNMMDPISAHVKGTNVRYARDDYYYPNDPNDAERPIFTGDDPSPHRMSQFVGRDLNKITRGQPISIYDALQRLRGDEAVRDRFTVNQIKEAHKQTREKIRQEFIKGLRLKPKKVRVKIPKVLPSGTPSLERKRGKSIPIVKDEL